MEIRLGSYAMALSAAMLLAACSGENPWQEAGGGKGTIVLNLTASGELGNLASGGRADVTADVPNFPTVDQFSIRLTPVGGTPVEYATVAEFEENMEAGVRAGAYTIEAYYGDPLDQGDKPYVYGVQTLRVTEQTVSTVDMTATLANSLVEVTYTDAFKSYFRNYSTTLKSDKNTGEVTVTGVDGATKYVTPGFINVTMAATYVNGKEAHLNPKNFSAEAAFLYRVKYDVNAGQVGNPTLSITFDDNIDEIETVEIDLSNDFFSAASPEVTVEGFTPGETLSAKIGSYTGDPLKFNISADGKIAEALLSVTSTNTEAPYAPSFGTSVNLFKADADTQAKLKAEGVTALGLFNNPDKIAMVDVTEFVKRLPEGTHEISLIVKDEKTRVSEPVTLTYVTIPVSVELRAAADKPYDKEEVAVDIYFDGDDFSKISFKTRNEGGSPADCVTGAPVAKGGNIYTYTLRLPVDRRAVQPVALYYNGKAKGEVEVKVAWTEPTITFDPFATWARVKIEGLSADFMNLAIEKGWFEILTKDKSYVPTYDATNKWFVYEGLTPATGYSIFIREDLYSTQFTTEAATDVPNGDFSVVHETINMTNVNDGGTWRATALSNHQNTSSIVRSEADGWSSINQKTCYVNATNNTWFRVPSTYVENGVCIVRSVAFDHDGVEPSRSGNAGNSTYYCTNTPTFKDEDKIAGELFLGSYNFSAQGESRTNGISHSSRPSSFSFEYTYTPMNGEKGEVTVEVLDAIGVILASGSLELDAIGEMTQKTITLSNYSFGSVAATLKVNFKSSNVSNPQVNVPTGRALDAGGLGLKDNVIAANAYKAVATGSVLTIDNVQLHYDK